MLAGLGAVPNNPFSNCYSPHPAHPTSSTGRSTHLERCVDSVLAVQEQQPQGEAHEAAARLHEVCLAAQHEGLMVRCGGGGGG